MLEPADILCVGEIYCMCLVCFVCVIELHPLNLMLFLYKLLETTPIPLSLMDIYVEARSH